MIVLLLIGVFSVFPNSLCNGPEYFYPKPLNPLLLGVSEVPKQVSMVPVHQFTPENPLVTALLLSTTLGLPPLRHVVGNHPEQGPVNPYITLLLSQYGRYLPGHAMGTKGLYYYSASNNYHNNQPFGSYKVYENAK